MFAFVKTELSIGAARLDHQPRRCTVIEKRGDASVGDSLCGDLHVAGLGWRGANRVRPPNRLPIDDPLESEELPWARRKSLIAGHKKPQGFCILRLGNDPR